MRVAIALLALAAMATSVAGAAARKANHAANAELISSQATGTKVVNSQNPYVLVYYENTCSNSARFMPIYNNLLPDLKKKYPNVKFGDINCNTPATDSFCTKGMSVTAYPTPVIYQRGYAPMECMYYEKPGELDKCIAKFLKTKKPGSSTQARGRIYT